MKVNLLQKFIKDDVIRDLGGAFLGLIPGFGALIEAVWVLVNGAMTFKENKKTVGPVPAFIISIENVLNIVLAIIFGFGAVVALITALFSFSWFQIWAAIGSAASAVGSYYVLGWILALCPTSLIMNFFFNKATAATKAQNKISEYVSAFVYLETADQEAGGEPVDQEKLTEKVKKRYHVNSIENIAGDDYYRRWKKSKSIVTSLHNELKKTVQERLGSTEDSALAADEQAIRISDTLAKQIDQTQASQSLDPVSLQHVLDEYNALVAAVSKFEQDYQDLDAALQGNAQHFTSPETVVVQLLKLEQMVSSFIEMFNAELCNMVGQDEAA